LEHTPPLQDIALAWHDAAVSAHVFFSNGMESASYAPRPRVRAMNIRFIVAPFQD
jgi:hypothetical protein